MNFAQLASLGNSLHKEPDLAPPTPELTGEMTQPLFPHFTSFWLQSAILGATDSLDVCLSGRQSRPAS